MKFIGMDPGASGAIAVLDREHVHCVLMRETPKDVSDFLSEHGGLDCVAYIEKVHSMPGQGVASSFKFGWSAGFLEGLLVANEIRYELVRPQKWQKEMGCLTKGDKNVTKRKAQQLFPSVKITHANADALLLAEYCRRMCRQELPSLRL